MTPESKVKQMVKEVLKEYNVYYVMPLGQQYGKSGVPDFICCMNGYFFSIETKAGKNRTTIRQEQNMNQIMKSGGSVIVIDESGVGMFKHHLAEFFHTCSPATNHPRRSMYVKGGVEVSNEPFPDRSVPIKTGS